MLKWTFALIVAVLVLVVAIFFLTRPKMDLSQYAELVNPRIAELSAQKMLVVEMVGDPDDTVGPAIGKLFKTLFTLKRQVEGVEMQPPRARWPKPYETPREEYLGIYALPIPDDVETLPEKVNQKPPEVKIETWAYGQVAEILHIGDYDDEKPTVDKLHAFITEQGYRIRGPHEEEYLKGPGMFGKGNPDEYQTIIRYEVEPADEAGPSPAAN